MKHILRAVTLITISTIGLDISANEYPTSIPSENVEATSGSIVSMYDLSDHLRAPFIDNYITITSNEFSLMPDEVASMYNLANITAYFQSESMVKSNATKPISSFSNTHEMKYEGIFGANPINNGKYSNVTTVYSLADETLVIIDEFDYESNGIKIAQISEMFNSSVNGNPATVSYHRSTKGSKLITLTWVANGKVYNVMFSGKSVKKNYLEQMLTIAGTIVG